MQNCIVRQDLVTSSSYRAKESAVREGLPQTFVHSANWTCALLLALSYVLGCAAKQSIAVADAIHCLAAAIDFQSHLCCQPLVCFLQDSLFPATETGLVSLARRKDSHYALQYKL